MKKLLLIAVGLLSFGILQAQEGWIEKNSNLANTKGIGQISVGMLDQTALWSMAINTDGTIFDAFTKSTDGGQTWTAGTFNAGTGLSQLFAFDENVCWAVFNTGATQGLYKTVNGGSTWAKKGTAFGASSFADILHFFNENDGCAMGDPVGGYFEIYTTTNGGETWTRVPSANIPAPTSGEYGITADYSASGDNIWFGTNMGRVFHSTDKGLHWTAALTNFGSAEVVQPEFADAMNGICYRSYLDLGIEPAIGVTTDGGATWTTVNVNGTMYARYFSYVPGTEATYVGSSGGVAGANGISYSTDGGYSWAVITEGYDFLATAWLNDSTGYAGSFARLSRTVGGMYIYDGPALAPFAVPVISVTPDQINAEAEVGASDVQDLTIANIGEADLTYNVAIIYPVPGEKSAPVSINGQGSEVRTLGYNGSTSIDPNARPASYNPAPTDDVVLHYDGDNFSAIGWSTVPVTPTVAARFTTDLTLPYAGMMIESVDIYINDPGTNFVLKIYDMGNDLQPGELLVSQPFTGQSLSWNNITLDNPVYITGADVWVGYQFTQTAADTFIPGTDEGPSNPNGDWITTGSVWGHLSANPDLAYNWNIRANLTGTPITQWLTVEPTTGTVPAASNEVLSVTCDATGLDVGTYTAILRVQSNDPQNPLIDVPVTFNVLPGGSQVSVILDFEAQTDWSLTFDPWTAVDVDGGATYGFDAATFPHMYEPYAFIAFNPNTTEPPMTDDPAIQPHDGVRFGACFNTVPPPFNDDWMISPQTTLGMNSSVTMWVKSYTDQYGLEKYNVLVSTTGMDPADFTSISGTSPMLAPLDWTEVTFDLSAYDGQTVYVAIQCVSEDAFIFMLDDVSIDFTVGVPENQQNVAVSVYPNPATDHLTIESAGGITQIDLFNQLGQSIYSQTVKNDIITLNTRQFNAGVYYIKVTTPSGVTTRKVMIR
jgi:photosystem II stability/assembly factor-like uncharacterized protein